MSFSKFLSKLSCFASLSAQTKLDNSKDNQTIDLSNTFVYKQLLLEIEKLYQDDEYENLGKNKLHEEKLEKIKWVFKVMADFAKMNQEISEKQLNFNRYISQVERPLSAYIYEICCMLLKDYEKTDSESILVKKEKAKEILTLILQYYCKEGYKGKREFPCTLASLRYKSQLIATATPQGFKLKYHQHHREILSTISELDWDRQFNKDFFIDETRLTILDELVIPFLKDVRIKNLPLKAEDAEFQKLPYQKKIDFIETLAYKNPKLALFCYERWSQDILESEPQLGGPTSQPEPSKCNP